MELDRTRLAKLLGLSSSSNEHEAAGAMRAANKLVKDAGETWESVLAGPERSFRISIQRASPMQAEEPWVAPHLRDRVMIDLMFRTVYAQPRTGSEDFWQGIDTMHNSFTQHGLLTQGQYVLLQKCYKRLTAANVPT